MATFVFVVHPEHEAAASLAGRARTWLQARRHDVVTVSDASDAPGQLDRPAQLAVSLGGDGTMLRAVALARSQGMPVLGVNLGRLGYLTEIEPPGLERALERFLAGDYGVEERMTLEVGVEPGGPGEAPDAPTAVVLNEAVVEKTVPGHTIRVTASIGGHPFVTYAADAILVATPTGSTAYNLSAHGPVLSPGMCALVLTPVSPHMLFDRPLVLDAEQSVRLELAGPRAAVLVLDGQSVRTLRPGDAVLCRAGPTPARLVTFGPRDFFSILRARFHLADR